MTHERAFGADTMELGHIDYSFKPVKPVVSNECQAMEVCQQNMIIPLFYGAMPNMGLYYTPDGPFENPGDLMKAFKIQEAWDSIRITTYNVCYTKLLRIFYPINAITKHKLFKSLNIVANTVNSTGN